MLLFGTNNKTKGKLSDFREMITVKGQALSSSKIGKKYLLDQDNRQSKKSESFSMKWIWGIGGSAFLAGNISALMGFSVYVVLGFALVTCLSMLSIPLIKAYHGQPKSDDALDQKDGQLEKEKKDRHINKKNNKKDSHLIKNRAQLTGELETILSSNLQSNTETEQSNQEIGQSKTDSELEVAMDPFLEIEFSNNCPPANVEDLDGICLRKSRSAKVP